MRKIVGTSVEGQITEIIYKGSHTHSIPQSTKRSWSSPDSSKAMILSSNEFPDQSYGILGSAQGDPAATPENSSISVVDDDCEQNSLQSKSEFDFGDDDEPDAKRWQILELIAFRIPRLGQKHFRATTAYRCKNPGCLVTKKVERASHDLKEVITNYPGKYNHDTQQPREVETTLLTGHCQPMHQVPSGLLQHLVLQITQ
ncbi:hypothetical protein ACET3Z_012491 [Daucus carota]